MFKDILNELCDMAWNIYWPLALGFMLSAIVRAYISTATISSKLGKSDAKGLALSTFFGAVSSSCSYAAASMSRTLLIKGATWSNAIAFMIASTNLVFEIFLVIVTMLGWAFFGGEVLGGLLLILIGTFFMKLLLNESSITAAKKHIHESEAAIAKNDPHAHHANMEMEKLKPTESEGHSHHNHISLKKSTTNTKKWKEAGGYFYMDVLMVGKDILIGVVIAAILSVVVPPDFWQSLFLQSSANYPSFLVLLWNIIIGILVALLAFVCSVGNILLAFVLWHEGINFGGVIAFILADLITLPMLMVYRKYYGAKMMFRLLVILILSILVTSVSIDYFFQWMDWIPKHPFKSSNIDMSGFKWNYQTVLNFIFIPLSLFFFFWGRKVMRQKIRV